MTVIWDSESIKTGARLSKNPISHARAAVHKMTDLVTWPLNNETGAPMRPRKLCYLRTFASAPNAETYDDDVGTGCI